jgi:hypothetical protein
MEDHVAGSMPQNTTSHARKAYGHHLLNQSRAKTEILIFVTTEQTKDDKDQFFHADT